MDGFGYLDGWSQTTLSIYRQPPSNRSIPNSAMKKEQQKTSTLRLVGGRDLDLHCSLVDVSGI